MSAPVLVGKFTPGTPEWVAARRKRLGGSEIAAVLGLSPYESRFALWHRKMGTAGPQTMNAEMDWGNRLEPVVAQKFCEVHPELAGMVGGSYVHPERDWQLASPDLLLEPAANRSLMRPKAHSDITALLEVKTSPFGEGWGQAGTDEIPLYYRCQVLWYLDVLGVPLAHVAVLISGCDYREYQVHMDADAQADLQVMRTAGEEFIRSLTAEQRPAIDDHTETYKVIRELHPEIASGEEIELPADVVLEYLDSKLDLTAAEKRHTLARSVVLDAMGDANYAIYLQERIARRQANQGQHPHLVSTRKDPRGKAVPTIQGSSAA